MCSFCIQLQWSVLRQILCMYASTTLFTVKDQRLVGKRNSKQLWCQNVEPFNDNHWNVFSFASKIWLINWAFACICICICICICVCVCVCVCVFVSVSVYVSISISICLLASRGCISLVIGSCYRVKQSGRSPEVVALFLLQSLVAIKYDCFNCMIQSKWNQLYMDKL